MSGISFIEHISFHAFRKGIRFWKTVLDVQGLTRTKIKIAGVDAIYATNRTRRFASGHIICTDFKRKGRTGKNERQMKKTGGGHNQGKGQPPGGSFGNDKEHYGLRRIRARTKATEILWIFLGPTPPMPLRSAGAWSQPAWPKLPEPPHKRGKVSLCPVPTGTARNLPPNRKDLESDAGNQKCRPTSMVERHRL